MAEAILASKAAPAGLASTISSASLLGTTVVNAATLTPIQTQSIAIAVRSDGAQTAAQRLICAA
jgi:hypothetical protein